jgi:hypothetical protein
VQWLQNCLAGQAVAERLSTVILAAQNAASAPNPQSTMNDLHEMRAQRRFQPERRGRSASVTGSSWLQRSCLPRRFRRSTDCRSFADLDAGTGSTPDQARAGRPDAGHGCGRRTVTGSVSFAQWAGECKVLPSFKLLDAQMSPPCRHDEKGKRESESAPEALHARHVTGTCGQSAQFIVGNANA